MKRAIAEGFDSIELAKRYTTVTMGPCQGRLCHLAVDPAATRSETRHGRGGDRHDDRAAAVGAGRRSGLLAGPAPRAAKRTSIHHRHEEAGARMMWTGAWRRPHSYGDAPAEARAVHDGARRDRRLDARQAARRRARTRPRSSSGSTRTASPTSKVGRVRYGVLTTDAGRIMDDGTIARLGDEHLLRHDDVDRRRRRARVVRVVERGLGLDVEIVNLTGALAAVNVAGPRARELLGRLTDADVSAEALTYLDAKRGRTSPACRASLLRIGFVGELGYELHCAEPVRRAPLGRARRRPARRPFGLEPQRILRLEKAAHHRRPGHRLRVEPARRRTCRGSPSSTRTTSSASGRSSTCRSAACASGSSASRWRTASLPAEGAQVVRDGRPAGRVTSARRSEQLGKAIGLAWVPPELRRGGRARSRSGSTARLEPARVRLRAVLRPRRGAAARREPARLPLADRARARRSSRARSPLARALAGATASATCRSLGKLEVRGDVERPRRRRRGAADHAGRARSSSGSPSACARAAPPRCRASCLRRDGGARRHRGRGRARCMRRLTDLDLDAAAGRGQASRGVPALDRCGATASASGSSSRRSTATTSSRSSLDVARRGSREGRLPRPRACGARAAS